MGITVVVGKASLIKGMSLLAECHGKEAVHRGTGLHGLSWSTFHPHCLWTTRLRPEAPKAFGRCLTAALSVCNIHVGMH